MTRSCPDCGRSTDEGARWCGACGAALPVISAPRRMSGVLGSTPRVRSRHRTSATVVAVAVAVALAVGVVTSLGRPDDVEPVVDADDVVEGEVNVPTDAPEAPVAGDDLPLELLATCDGPDGPEGCVRWVQPAGQLARPGTEPLVTVVADRLVALDPETGRRRWSAAVTTPAAPPAAVGDHTILVEDAGGVRALAADDGDERWRVAAQHLPMSGPNPTEPSVVVLDDLEGMLTARTVADGAVLWTHAVGPSDGVPATVVQLTPDAVLVATASSTTVLDAATGRARWSAGAPGRQAEVPVAVTAQHVVSLRRPVDDGPPELRVRTVSGRLLAERRLAVWERVLDLAVTAAHLVLRTTDELLALDLDTAKVAWRRGDLPGPLVTSRPIPIPPASWLRGRAGFGAIATQTFSLVVLDTNGTGTVLEPRNGRDSRRFGEEVEGLRLSDGFLTRRHLWRIEATSLEVVDLFSLDQVLRIDVRAPPRVVSTDPVVVATSGRLVRLDAAGSDDGADG